MPVVTVLLAVLCATLLTAQVNLSFDTAGEGNSAEGWRATAGSYAWIDDGCTKGKCIQVTAQAGAAPGIVLQSFDAAPFRGKMFRFSASAKPEAGGRAQLWVRVDRKGGQPGFFENMMANPIVDWDWTTRHIDGFVHEDAEKVFIGFMASTKPARFDEASFAITGDLPRNEPEPARPLSSTGLRNVEAFAKLAGLVRHFHPSDQSASADWNRIVIEGVRAVEPVETSEQLAAAMLRVLAPIAPTLRVYTGGTAPKPHPALTPANGLELLRWRHRGFGGGAGPQRIYSSERIRKPSEDWNPERDIYKLDCGGGVTALVPLAVFADSKHSLPTLDSAAAMTVADAAWSAKNRSVRIGAVVLAWNIFQHFYPYFDVVKTDWAAVLPETLRRAAADSDDVAFHRTVHRMVAELKDGHGGVTYRFASFPLSVPLRVEWIDNKVIVTGVGAALETEVHPGDEIVSVGGKTVAQAIAEAEPLISGATFQWTRRAAMRDALAGPRDQPVELTIRRAGAVETRIVTTTFQVTPQISTDPRPKDSIAELQPGIWYVDLTRAQDAEFEAAVPKLATAKGIVFDMRGYPRVGIGWFSHVSDSPMVSQQWHVPVVTYPGRMEFERGGEWTLEPRAPYFKAKKVFLTNGSAISYAESTMGIVEHYKLGEIIGEPTAGTNGNVNPFELPGGYRIAWTGMKVLKHDGSQHHMVGIQPTIRLTRTQAGVAAGRDELLERAMHELTKQR